MVTSTLMAPPRRRRRTPRAPRRTGDRTTLRVPDDLARTVARYAEQHRTSTNDALIRLALEGAARYEYDREVEELARIRGEAIMRLPRAPPDAEMPSGDEIAEAILAWRLGLVDEEESGA
ncbi:MAG TPA: hypothetical protein VGO48_07400 [Conexibacter sp.]|jgi:hypothetical protein|nr:hypothetical protein [Conexibacter sp.]